MGKYAYIAMAHDPEGRTMQPGAGNSKTQFTRGVPLKTCSPKTVFHKSLTSRKRIRQRRMRFRE